MDEKKGVFLKVPNKKGAFLEKKNIGSKNHQNFAFFSKGLVHGFCQKMEIFLIFSFYAKLIKRKCFLKVPKEKKPFRTKEHRLKKSPTFCIFFKRG